MITAGKLDADRAAELGLMLSHDLRNYPLDWVDDAIRQHREDSPFWPALSDLMKFIKPKVERHYREAERRKLDEKIAREKAGLPPEEPAEIRAAAAQEWREWGRADLEKRGIDAEERMIHPNVRKRRKIEKQKAAPTKGQMVASLKRIADFERERGNEALAEKLLEPLTDSTH